ncbi:MAG: hypothetical protein ABI652_06885, partial [Acidobacteriota bacterium]
MTPPITRAQGVLIAGALITCLLAGSHPRVIGDGGEYIAQTANFAAGQAPPLLHKQLPIIEQIVARLDPSLEGWHIEPASVAARSGGRDFLHFWFYALLSTPAWWLTSAAGVSTLWAFTLTNTALFLWALWIVLPRV